MDGKIKRGQIALWVVLAIILAASILLYAIVAKSKRLIDGRVSIDSPESYIEECARQEAVKNADMMLKQGGFLNPGNFKEFKKIKIEYLCDQTSSYKPCVQQHPGLISDIESQLYEKINKRADECFTAFKREVEKNGGKAEIGSQEVKVSLGTGKIFVDIGRKISIIKGNSRAEYEKFNYDFIHPIFDLSTVAMEIANQEAVYCHFDPLGYTVYENQFKIRKELFSDYTIIYTINDKKTNKTMSIAIRSCAIPPGMILPEG